MGKVIRTILASLLVIALVIGGAAVFLVPRIKAQLSSRSGETGTPVRLEEVRVGDLVRTVTAPGMVEATTRVSVSARISALITELPLDEGDPVRRDDLLVKLDDADLLAQLRSAEASLKAEEARLAGAQANHINAVSEWERQQALYATDDVSRSALENAEASMKRAESELLAAEAGIEMARANIARVREDLRYTEIKSPINGTITKLNAEVGEIVVTGTMNNAGTVIMEVADLNEMIVKAEVDESDISDVRIGQRARVFLNAYEGQQYEGTVQRIALQRTTARDGSDVFLVEILLNTGGQTLREGLTGSVDIEVETLSGAMLVPSQAVLDVRVDELPIDIARDNPAVDRNKTFARVVYLLEEGKAVAKPVRVGPSDLRTTALLAGVDAGSRVVIGPYKSLLALNHGMDIREDKPEADGEGVAPAEGGDAVAEEGDEDRDEPAEQPDAASAAAGGA